MIQIKNANLSDVSNLLEIENDTFVGGEKYNQDFFIYNLKDNKFAKTLILFEDDVAISYLIYWITFDSATIISLATKKDFQQKGYATLLLNEMLKDLKNNNVETVTLEVRKSNTNAIKLYEKHGFVFCNTKKNYYENPCEDALYYVKGV